MAGTAGSRPGTPEVETETTPLLVPSAHDIKTAATLRNGNHLGDDRELGHEAATDAFPNSRQKALKVLPAVGIGIFMAATDQTLIISSYGRIGTDLQALDKTGWIATSYFLTLTSFQPLYGRLSDIFGRKPALLFAYTVFGLGCLGCGFAQNINQLIVARAISGVGGGGMTTIVAIIWSDILPVHERGMWQGIANLIYALGSGLGGPLGGLLVDTPGIGWRWPFIMQAPLSALASIGVFFTLDLPRKEFGDWRINLKRIDFLGAFLLILAVLTLTIGFDRGANISWSAPVTLVFLAVSIMLFVIFGYAETYISSEPYTPHHIIFDRVLLANYACNFFSFASHISAMFFVPLFFQAVHDLNSGQAAIRMVPTVLVGVMGGLSGGLMAKWLRKYTPLTILAAVLLFSGCIALIAFSAVDVGGLAGIIVGMSINSFGNGIICTSTLVGITANVESEDQAIATACSYLFRALGSVIGITAVSATVQKSLRVRLQSQLSSIGDATKIIRQVRESLESIRELEPSTRDIVRACYRGAITDGMIMLTVLALLTLISAFFSKGKRVA